MTKTLHFHALAAVRRRSGEDPLLPFLRAAKAEPVSISARDVARIDAHRLQILLSAQRQWLADGVAFSLVDTSPVFCEGLERLGLAADHFDRADPETEVLQ